MRQIQTDYSLIVGGHDVIFKVLVKVLPTDLGPLLLPPPLQLWSLSRVLDRLVELAQSVLCLDDVEILPVCLGQRERFRETLGVQPGLDHILPLIRLKLNKSSEGSPLLSSLYDI